MGTRRDDHGALEALERLTKTLQAAARVAADLSGDAEFRRLRDVFLAMPRQDRAPILGALEREVDARRLSRATEGVTGQAMHPNPNARFYLRSHGPEAQRGDLERDEMMLATLRAMQVMHLLVTPDIYPAWLDATREALGHVDSETRQVVERLLREVLDMLVECDGQPRVRRRADSG